VTNDGCQANALAAYFGEVRSKPCGHCTHCRTGRRQAIPPRSALPAIASALDADSWSALRAEHPDELGEPRQGARFLCGLTGPAFTRAKLSRQPLFGALAEYPFGDVEAWCSSGDEPI